MNLVTSLGFWCPIHCLSHYCYCRKYSCQQLHFNEWSHGGEIDNNINATRVYNNYEMTQMYNNYDVTQMYTSYKMTQNEKIWLCCSFIV